MIRRSGPMTSSGKERSIIMSAPMVRAILDNRKHVTRRIVRFPQWADATADLEFSNAAPDDWMPAALCKATGCFANLPLQYGKPGDRLWLRETWMPAIDAGGREVRYAADYDDAGRRDMGKLQRWRPSIHMPRWASRITIELTDVRVERLQGISEEDAKAEGVKPHGNQATKYGLPDAHGLHWKGCMYRRGFAVLWNSLNPWVWVLEFRRTSD